MTLDPAVNFLIRRYVMECRHTDGRHIRRHYEVTEFAEPHPGVYFPTVRKFRVDIDGVQKNIHTARVTGLRVNTPVAADRLRIKFDHGMKMLDGVQGTEYTVDENGAQLTAPQLSPPFQLPPPVTGSRGEGSSVEATGR